MDYVIFAQDFELYCHILPIPIYFTEKDKYLDQINFDTY